MILSTQTHEAAARFGDIEAVRHIAAAGFDAVDFTMFEGYNEHDLFYSCNYEEYAYKLKQTAIESGVFFNQAHAPFPSYRVGDEEYNKKTYPKLHRSIEICGILGVKNIIIHPVDFKGDNKKKNIAMYQSLLPTAKTAGVKIALENMWGVDPRRGCITYKVCSEPNEFVDFLHALDPEWFTACLDLGHIGLVGEDETNFIHALGREKLTALHVHDTTFVQDSHTLPFCGKMDWVAITKALKDIGYKGDFTFEADNFLTRVPNGFFDTALRYMHDCGRYLISMIEE